MFVLRSGDRTVVVDTGGPADEEQIRRMIPFGYVVTEEERVENALTRLGVRAEDVDLVINTHLHWDHCSNNDAFPDAEILVQRAELDHATGSCPQPAQAYGFHGDSAPPFARCLDRVRALDGASEIAAGLGVLPLPGHSPGSQGVRVDTGEGPSSSRVTAWTPSTTGTTGEPRLHCRQVGSRISLPSGPASPSCEVLAGHRCPVTITPWSRRGPSATDHAGCRPEAGPPAPAGDRSGVTQMIHTCRGESARAGCTTHRGAVGAGRLAGTGRQAR
ncbi:N-acyl homoserine lactonase family protein [Streptomyces phaeochromogenes]|uniref:N-acyl homoserine lactonase family protein n=1 Tax=Streptomyces phaeochromogenes TaxID=1923 RepID=UPI00398D097A